MAPGYFDGAVPPIDLTADLGFTVQQQRVVLNVEFASKIISGTTEITIQPTTDQLKRIRLNCRQARITEARIEGKPAVFTYVDPYDKLRMRGKTTVHQHQTLRNRIDPYVKLPPESELSLTIPSKVRIQELQGEAALRDELERHGSDFGQTGETPITSHAPEAVTRFAPIKVFLEFTVDNFRDGVHFVGFDDDDSRYSHIFTRNSISPGSTSSIFPCVDDLNTRCMWDITIRCPRTLGDAFRRVAPAEEGGTTIAGNDQALSRKDEYLIPLTEEERTLDLSVIASADLTDDITDPQDPTMRTVSFVQVVPVCARHIGFAIGPFEHVELSEFRELGQEDKLGQNVTHVHGYCLPGRADELRNACMPMAMAVDYFFAQYGSYPFTNYKMIFVDDLVRDVSHTASLSICSNRLLFPETVLEPLDPNTRILIHAFASQYIGVNIIPKEPTDLWVITGVAGFMSDLFMKKLAGNNEYRFRQKLASEKVFELDVERYSIHQLGAVLDIDPSEYDFLALKSPLVLYILDRRLTKASGSAGMARIVNRIMLDARSEKTMPNGEINTDYFQKICERLGHTKLDAFFRQWVLGAGCPMFNVVQRFNKKKLVVEMHIYQKQLERKIKPKLETHNFMREVKEQVSEAWAPGIQPVFTGPMTIRIHEADGTPYEHIVEIKDAVTKFEVPYNTKYKRLKRSKRAKDRAMGNSGPGDVNDPDADNDTLLYCLGDVLQSEDEVRDWRLTDWSKDDEDRMGQESYEWIRMDADFEWIGRIHLVMPVYMYVSQLQQDRDVVAQYESLQYVAAQNAHPLMSTILIRTLMDRRYFHGIRTLAAAGLARCATEDLNNIGLFHLEKAFQEFFCIPDSPMPRANNFSDRTSYIIQCAIPKAMARVRDRNGKVPMRVRKFFVDKLKFNDNSNNEFSDNHYVATLMNCLADALAASAPEADYRTADGYEDDDRLEELRQEELFKNEAINELERYRRIDEWIASFQNVYSVTAMGCMQKLQLAGVIPNQLKQIMMYTQAGNADNVRLKAFASLVDLKVFKKSPSVLKYLLFSIADDTSPYFRERLTRVLGEALGSIAISEAVPDKPAPKPLGPDSGLILEQEAVVEVQPMEDLDKSPAEIALASLKNALKDNETFQQALWQVIQSPLLDLSEVVGFLDIAALLYEPSTALMVSLLYPRYKQFKSWESRQSVSGRKSLVVILQDTTRFRTTPINGLGLEGWLLVQKHGLKWTGRLSREVRDYQKDLVRKEKEQKAQIAALQTQIAASSQTMPAPSTAMSPPPLPTPSGHKPGPKLSLKRKQSTASDSGRPGSPKRQQFSPPAATPPAATPKAQRPPSISKSKALTPAPSAPKPAKVKVKKERKVVRLRFANQDRLQAVLAKKPRPSLKISTASKGASATPRGTPASAHAPTPSSTTPSLIPSKTISPGPGGKDFFASPAVQKQAAASQNLGGFRFYGGGGESAATTRVKTEDAEPASGISPLNTTWGDKKDKHSDTGSKNGSACVPSRSGTPKISLSRPATPGQGSAVTPKAAGASLDGGSRAATPSTGDNIDVAPRPALTAEPEKKKGGFKLKLGKKPPPT